MTFSYVDAVNLALAPLSDIGVEAYVAGGFLRDAYLGVEPKDIDIFVFGPEGDGWRSPMAHLEALQNRLGVRTHPLNPDFFYPIEEGGTEVVGVLEYEQTVFGKQVQVIMVDKFNRESLLERFDYGACRVMTDGYTVWVHPHFKEDVQNKEFRLRRMREDLCLQSSVERYARFKRRSEFEEWRWFPYESWHDPIEDFGRADPTRQISSVGEGPASGQPRARRLYETVQSPYCYEEAPLADFVEVSR